MLSGLEKEVPRLSDADRDKIRAMGENFARVWMSPHCPAELKKKIARQGPHVECMRPLWRGGPWLYLRGPIWWGGLIFALIGLGLILIAASMWQQADTLDFVSHVRVPKYEMKNVRVIVLNPSPRERSPRT
jgi:hypothetical protein